MEISGIKGAVDFYRYVSQRASSLGATFADALSEAAETEESSGTAESCPVGSELKILGETLMEVYRNSFDKSPLEGGEKNEKKDFWELRTERQKLLDEYFEKKELQRRAFEKSSLKKHRERESFFSGEGVLFLHSAAADVFAHMSLL